MKPLNLPRIALSALFMLTVSIPLSAAGGGGAQTNPIPSNGLFMGPVGILFPALPSAAGVNPAALTLAPSTTAIQLAYSPSTGNTPSYIFTGLAAASKSLGLGMGYFGQKNTLNLTNGGFAGVGFKIDPVSVGLSARDSDFARSGGTSIDLGLITGEGKGLTFGFVMYALNTSPQLDAGIGFGGGKKYNMEFNVLLPPFNRMSGNTYVMTVAGTLYAFEVVGLSFKTSYYTLGSTYQHMVGVTGWLSDAFSIFLQFSTPHTWTAGATVIF